MLNHISIMGRLTRDPELRTTQSGTPVASFTVACERDYTAQGQQRETDFIDCVAWRQTGEFVSKYFAKGQMIVVDGRLQSRKWQDRDGNNRTSWEINTDHAYFGEPKREDSRSDSYSGYTSPPPAYPPANSGMRNLGPGTGEGNPFTQSRQQTFSDLPDDDGDLPF